ncbi:acyltransferase [Deltaproteobacteria bacterium TL4]
MLSFLPTPLVGTMTALLVVLNTIFWSSLLFGVTFLKFLLPIEGWQNFCSKVIVAIAEFWIDCNSCIMWLTLKIQWDVQGLEGLRPKDSYLLVVNHRSWADIVVLQHLFRHKIPFLKFFLKQELIWVPILGIAWWALDYPFMKRYSKEFLEKRPELRGKDLETTRRHCEKFKHLSVTVINFLEGTRFDESKHHRQASPYNHLLQPKAGGVALVLSSMGDYLTHVLNVTIVYPENRTPLPFRHLITGKIPKIVVRVEKLPIPENVVGRDYLEDESYRQRIQQWVNQLWVEKEKLIEILLKDSQIQ